MTEAEKIAAGLSEAQRLYLATIENDGSPAKEVREHVYGPDWHRTEAMQRIWRDEDVLLNHALVLITLPISTSTCFLTTEGSKVRKVLEREASL